jgi:hypothetical protein
MALEDHESCETQYTQQARGLSRREREGEGQRRGGRRVSESERERVHLGVRDKERKLSVRSIDLFKIKDCCVLDLRGRILPFAYACMVLHYSCCVRV